MRDRNGLDHRQYPIKELAAGAGIHRVGNLLSPGVHVSQSVACRSRETSACPVELVYRLLAVRARIVHVSTMAMSSGILSVSSVVMDGTEVQAVGASSRCSQP
jgi:hypothetical protein